MKTDLQPAETKTPQTHGYAIKFWKMVRRVWWDSPYRLLPTEWSGMTIEEAFAKAYELREAGHKPVVVDYQGTPIDASGKVNFGLIGFPRPYPKEGPTR